MLTLNQRLNKVLKTISNLSTTTEMIAINASISASKMNTDEGRAFKVISKEIRMISNKSLDELYGLDELLAEVKYLSEIINVAGRQRMLIQKSMKLRLLSSMNIGDKDEVQKELNETIDLFESSHKKLFKSSFNNAKLEQSLENLFKDWQTYKSLLHTDVLEEANKWNNSLVQNMNNIVFMYQSLA